MHLLGLAPSAAAHNSDTRGRLINSFVLSQLRPLLGLGNRRARAYHLRDTSGRREVDTVLESNTGEIVALEMKSAAVVRPSDARHLEWLRDEQGDSFRAGIIFHTASMTVPLSDRIWAMPIAAIWR